MKLIRCKTCDDVIRLIHTRWRMCECGKSGGQYNGITMSATVGGDCEVIGIRNDYFEYPQFSEDRIERATLIQGEYLHDNQVFRINSPEGPNLDLIIEKEDDKWKITFPDPAQVSIRGYDPTPPVLYIPYSDTPSFKDYMVK